MRQQTSAQHIQAALAVLRGPRNTKASLMRQMPRRSGTTAVARAGCQAALRAGGKKMANGGARPTFCHQFRNMTNRHVKTPLRIRPRTVRCRRCAKPVKVGPLGRVPEFCSASCRQRVYEGRRGARPHRLALRPSDIAQLRRIVRDEVWKILRHEALQDVEQDVSDAVQQADRELNAILRSFRRKRAGGARPNS